MHERRFDGMGDIYTKYRPSYPEELFTCISEELSVGKDSKIADIGSGTGKFSRQLLSLGALVYAVEPNADMRTVAEKELGSHEFFLSVNGTAEHTGLNDASIDLVTAAQAFHWFDRQTFKRECRRILKPGGRVLLCWNSRDMKSPLVQENDELNQKYCPNFRGFSCGMRGATKEGEFGDFFDGAYDERVLRNDLTFDEEGYIGRNLSSSYAPKQGDKNYDAYVAEMKILFHSYAENGTLLMPNLTLFYIGVV